MEVSDDIARSLPRDLSTSLTSSRASSPGVNGSDGIRGRNGAHLSRRASKGMGSILDTINSSILNSFVPIDQSRTVDDGEDNDNLRSTIGSKRSHDLVNGSGDHDDSDDDEPRTKMNGSLTNGMSPRLEDGDCEADFNENHLSDSSLHRGVREVVEFGVSTKSDVSAKEEDTSELYDEEGNPLTETEAEIDDDTVSASLAEPHLTEPDVTAPDVTASDLTEPTATDPASPGTVKNFSTPLAESPTGQSINTISDSNTGNHTDADQTQPDLDDRVILDETAPSLNEIDESACKDATPDNGTHETGINSTNGHETESLDYQAAAKETVNGVEDEAAAAGKETVNGVEDEAAATASNASSSSSNPKSPRNEDREQSSGIRAAVTRVLEALNFIARSDPATDEDDSSRKDNGVTSLPSGQSETEVRSVSDACPSPPTSSPSDTTLLCMSTSVKTRLEDQWRDDASDLLSKLGIWSDVETDSPKLLIWPNCVYKTARSSLPRELILYHVIETMRALSECAFAAEKSEGENNPDEPSSKTRKLSAEFKSRLRNMLLIEDVQEDDVDGYKALHKMDISLSNGDPGNVARIIMEGYRDALAEETDKIRDRISGFKIFHKDVGGAASMSASSVESALFILLDKTSDPGDEFRRQLTTLKTRLWRMAESQLIEKQPSVIDHVSWPPEDERVREEAESIFNYVQQESNEKIRFSVLPKVGLVAPCFLICSSNSACKLFLSTTDFTILSRTIGLQGWMSYVGCRMSPFFFSFSLFMGR